MIKRSQDDQVRVQILITCELRDSIDVHAKNLGFDTLQDFTRVIYRTVVNEQLRFNLLSPSNQIAGTHVTEDDFKEYQRNKLGKYLKSLRHDEIDDYE